MKVIRNWNDLEPYGVSCLTGEACGYGYRLLCDLNAMGVQLVQNCLEISEIKLRDAWNSKVNGEPAIASIMLPPSMITPLAIFALLDAGCRQVFTMYSGEVYGVEVNDNDAQVADFVKYRQGSHCAECDRYGKNGGIQFQYRNSGYSRNRHQMSGRAV